MKKQLLLIVMLLSAVASAFAAEVEIDGLWYEVNKETKEATVIQYKNNVYYNGDIVIPETVVYEGVTCSVTSIGFEAFQGCSGLTSVTISNSVSSIANDAFAGCSSLTSVIIPNSVTSIRMGTFSRCSGLTSVTIPNGVTSIGMGAFFRCSGLTSITIPNSVTSIGDAAFQWCSGLTSVTIPNSVTSLGGWAFDNCSGLTSIVIGGSVKVINSEAFSDCSKLTDVTCYAENVPSTESNAFEGSNIENATLHVPTASINAYKTTEPWSGFKVVEESVTGIKDIKANATSDSPIYDQQGRHVEKTTKGLYIMNGKKVVMK